ncbi:MAG: cob(I)yrinic acid a,c-diamide adenosyltransferase [Bacteroidia bacterium]|nr:cob(I)yrinic acid a,c-diamide adenosyltransferase [Bacteroidia bacterium]MDW8334202.1 cob(I)yrinic acid a,c-diamide adenosyltransferase [Bacteroidia bacterium]
MKVYTKRGDDGKTSLLSGNRMPKYAIRIDTYGTIDELNSFLGLLHSKTSHLKDFILRIQHKLFDIGSHLAAEAMHEKYGLKGVEMSDIESLEKSIDDMDSELPALKNFILPGSCELNALAHVCRTICRRAERKAVMLSQSENVKPEVIMYLNRLSDWFFVYARYVSMKEGVKDIEWQKG